LRIKLGPAIAGGNAVVLKPSELTPLPAIKLVGYPVAAGLPSNYDRTAAPRTSAAVFVE
jgi:acyl-CoA reductase-like NAD-dependent aldehyde dehydrogenase